MFGAYLLDTSIFKDSNVSVIQFIQNVDERPQMDLRH